MTPRMRALLASAALMPGLLIAITSIGLTAPASEPMPAAEPRPLRYSTMLESASRWLDDDAAIAPRPVVGAPRYLTLPAFDQVLLYVIAAVALPPTAPLADVSAPPPVLRPTIIANARASTRASTPPRITARNAVVLDEQSLTVLYDKGAHEQRPPASLTKIVTAALAVQLGDLDDIVDVTVDAYDMPGSSLMIIRPGEQYTLRDVTYGMMLRSGNDAALAIGRHLAMNDETFVYQMNVLVERLGLKNTHFIDPHGLGGRDHYSSAYDLAVLARYGMQFPEFATVVGAGSWTAEGSRTIVMKNLNPFMNLYTGADGLKTGFTEAAGPTFVGSAVRDGRRLYVVLLNSGARWADAADLLDWAFENHMWLDHTVSAASEADMEDWGVVFSSTAAIEVIP